MHSSGLIERSGTEQMLATAHQDLAGRFKEVASYTGALVGSKSCIRHRKRRRGVHGMRNAHNMAHRQVFISTLDRTDVRAVQVAFKGQGLL